MTKVLVAQSIIDNLHPDIAKYPCEALGTGICPMPLQAGYQYDNGKLIEVLSRDGGTPLSRRRFGARHSTWPLSFVFDGEQKAAFESWILNHLNAGTEWFYMPLLTGDYTLEVCKVKLFHVPGEDAAFQFLGRTKVGGTRWSLKATVIGFRPKLEKYASNVTVKDTTSGIQSGRKALESIL